MHQNIRGRISFTITKKGLLKCKIIYILRKGPWKIIVGHHYLPLIFDRVYNETTTG